MPKGVVIDTNVLEQANNPQEVRYIHCLKLLEFLRETTQVIIYFDEGFDIDVKKNKSLIWNEYNERLRFGMEGYALLLLLVNSNRIDFVSKTIRNSSTKKKIRKWVHKTYDVAFVGVAYNSNEKTLISHDFDDFPQQGRDELFKEIKLKIVIARTYLPTK